MQSQQSSSTRRNQIAHLQLRVSSNLPKAAMWNKQWDAGMRVDHAEVIAGIASQPTILTLLLNAAIPTPSLASQ